MRRREVLRLRADEGVVAAPVASPPEKRAQPGCCPRCGSFVGRSLRRHTLMCDGTFTARAVDHAAALVGEIERHPDELIVVGNR